MTVLVTTMVLGWKIVLWSYSALHWTKVRLKKKQGSKKTRADLNFLDDSNFQEYSTKEQHSKSLEDWKNWLEYWSLEALNYFEPDLMRVSDLSLVLQMSWPDWRMTPELKKMVLQTMNPEYEMTIEDLRTIPEWRSWEALTNLPEYWKIPGSKTTELVKKMLELRNSQAYSSWVQQNSNLEDLMRILDSSLKELPSLKGHGMMMLLDLNLLHDSTTQELSYLGLRLSCLEDGSSKLVERMIQADWNLVPQRTKLLVMRIQELKNSLVSNYLEPLKRSLEDWKKTPGLKNSLESTSLVLLKSLQESNLIRVWNSMEQPMMSLADWMSSLDSTNFQAWTKMVPRLMTLVWSWTPESRNSVLQMMNQVDYYSILDYYYSPALMTKAQLMSWQELNSILVLMKKVQLTRSPVNWNSMRDLMKILVPMMTERQKSLQAVSLTPAAKNSQGYWMTEQPTTNLEGLMTIQDCLNSLGYLNSELHSNLQGSSSTQECSSLEQQKNCQEDSNSIPDYSSFQEYWNSEQHLRRQESMKTQESKSSGQRWKNLAGYSNSQDYYLIPEWNYLGPGTTTLQHSKNFRDSNWRGPHSNWQH